MRSFLKTLVDHSLTPGADPLDDHRDILGLVDEQMIALGKRHEADFGPLVGR